MTPKEEIIRRCRVRKNGEGCIYFIETFCKIVGQQGGRHPIKLMKFQKAYIRTTLTNKIVIVLKPRQVGMSTITALLLLYECLFTLDGRFVCISMNENEAMNLLYKVRVAFDELPKEIFEELLEPGSATRLHFASDSIIEVRASGPNAGRSLTPTRVLMDEAAFMDKKLNNNSMDSDLANKIWTSVQNSLNVVGRASVLSTPNGCGGFFHRMWTMAVEGTKYAGNSWRHGEDAEVGANGMTPFYIRWDDFETRDQAWFDQMKTEYKNRDRMFNQEVLAEFLGSGDNVLSVERIKQIEIQDVKEPITMTEDKTFYTWEAPIENEKYIAALDVSGGRGDDCHALQIFKRKNLEQVAEYRGKGTTQQLADIVFEKSSMYNNAELIIETNYGMGVAMLDMMSQKGYYNIYRQDNKKDGLQVTPREKEVLVNLLTEYVGDGRIGIRSLRLLNEMKTYVWKNNKAQAEAGFHDDLISATQIAIYVKHSHREATDANWTFRLNTFQAARDTNLADYMDKIKGNKLAEERKLRLEQMIAMGADTSRMGLSDSYLKTFDFYVNGIDRFER